MRRASRWVTGSLVRDFVLFALVLAWIAQVLVPFGEATRIPSVAPFVLFLACLFAADLTAGLAWVRWTLKGLFVALFVYNHYYDQYELYDWLWVKNWWYDMHFGAQSLASSPLNMIAESVRTTFFYLALWGLQSFLRQSLRTRFGIFLLMVLGAAGLGVLDTFFVESAKSEALWWVLLGLVILAFTQLPRIERVARMPQRLKSWPTEWLAATLALAVLVTGVGFVVPKKEEPTWPDPVAWLQGKDGDGKPTRQKIGYGSDDQQLGGPFEMDDTVVFKVVSNDEGYYRGESKPIYTGRGWVSGNMGLPLQSASEVQDYQKFEAINLGEVLQGMMVPGRPAEGRLKFNQDVKKAEATFQFEQDMAPVLFNQYRMVGVTGLSAANGPYRYSEIDSRLDMGQLRKGDSYTVVSEVPYFDPEALKKATLPEPNRALSPYLQVPDSVPQRVRDLARQVTQNAATAYEKAQALEDYLRQTYMYETEDVPVPGEGQDFVDQFLFESRKGYCDHFSSSMVIMARTLGIPARWVKGFTKGEVDLSYRTDNPDAYLYVVRNRNAHSWPELYFEGVGWVAFEPTATFFMNRNYKEQATLAQPAVPLPETKKGQEEEQEEAGTTSTGLTVDWKALGVYAGVLAAVLLCVALLYRRKLMTAFYLRLAYKGEGDSALLALARLFVVMERLGWKRTGDMTVREYALQLAGDHALRGREMVSLAKLFERVRYGRKTSSEQEKREIRELWNRMIRKAGRIKKK
jgi:transglutaminase-like putative cysteine protease